MFTILMDSDCNSLLYAVLELWGLEAYQRKRGAWGMSLKGVFWPWLILPLPLPASSLPGDKQSLPQHAITVFCLVSGLTKAMGPVGVGTEASETMNPQLSFILLLSRTCHKKKNQQFKD